MSNAQDSSNPAAHHDSTAPSPTGTPTQPKHFEPITHDHDHDADTDDGDEETSRTTGTMRRNRPPAIATRSRDNYGISTPLPPNHRRLLLTCQKAPWIPTTQWKRPPPKTFKHLPRMRAAKAYKALHRRLASKCFLLNHCHQRASQRCRDAHLLNTTILTKAKNFQ